MNQGRIWCVVHPTVGLPLFLGSVALTSLAVHTAVMTHTNWMSNYWQGAARTRTTDAATAAPAAFSMKVTPVPATTTSQAAFVITVSPTSTSQTQAVNTATQQPTRTASAN